MQAILFKLAFVISMGIFFVPKAWKQFFAFTVSFISELMMAIVDTINLAIKTLPL